MIGAPPATALLPCRGGCGTVRRVILYCHCAYADVIPATVKTAVRRALGRAAERTVAVSDLCRLAAQRDARLAAWSGESDLTVVACYPRAVRVLFEQAGAPLPPGVMVLNMREDTPDVIAEQLGLQADAAEGEPLPVPPAAGEWVPWFPAIEAARCRNCRQCLEFCVFGVYELDGDGNVRVADPAKCKNQCPACARMCPEGAIVFAKCTDPRLAGAEGAQGSTAEDPGEDLDALIARRRARAAAFRKARAEKATAAGDPENTA